MSKCPNECNGWIHLRVAMAWPQLCIAMKLCTNYVDMSCKTGPLCAARRRPEVAGNAGRPKHERRLYAAGLAGGPSVWGRPAAVRRAGGLLPQPEAEGADRDYERASRAVV
eukprot:scaffold134690_cov20-Prasinocladus_malaysianus.AAC.2